MVQEYFGSIYNNFRYLNFQHVYSKNRQLFWNQHETTWNENKENNFQDEKMIEDDLNLGYSMKPFGSSALWTTKVLNLRDMEIFMDISFPYPLW